MYTDKLQTYKRVAAGESLLACVIIANEKTGNFTARHEWLADTELTTEELEQSDADYEAE